MSKKSDNILIILSALLLIGLLSQIQKCIVIIKVLIGITLCILLYYEKLKPYRSQLYSKHDRFIGRIERIINPVQKALSHLPKINVGTRIQMESGIPALTFFLIALLIIL